MYACLFSYGMLSNILFYDVLSAINVLGVSYSTHYVGMARSRRVLRSQIKAEPIQMSISPRLFPILLYWER